MSPNLLTQRLDDAAGRVEAALDRATAEERGIPQRLRAAMRHAVLGGGKRLRPFLVIETAALFGVAPERALPVATALECVHCYSLVHDDLPSMDDDDLRRGRPTVHRAFDEATAILAGDALLTLAFELATAEEADPDPAVRARLARDLARAAGAAGMVAGQMLDLTAAGRYAPDGRPLAHSIDEILALQALKTGALFRFAVEAGAVLGRADAEAAHALSSYARALGQAFQIADDLLDALADAGRVGKATGKDAAAGKATLVGLMGIEPAKARLAALVHEGETALAPFGARAEVLSAAIRFVAGRDR